MTLAGFSCRQRVLFGSRGLMTTRRAGTEEVVGDGSRAGTGREVGMLSIVIPVFNESENIQTCLERLWDVLRDLPHELLVCYDFDEDSTIPAIGRMSAPPPSIRLVKNTLGTGVAFALRSGFQAARGDVVVSTMADLSDPPSVIPAMAEKIRAGAAVVSGSRYMRGGSQEGGPWLKGLLSRTAGVSLHCLVGLGTRDITNNFRAYSKAFLDLVDVESQAGFEVAIELTVKAHLMGLRVEEVPCSWHDRSAGSSRFLLWRWLPRYARWYRLALVGSIKQRLLGLPTNGRE